jgi:hypothetical protein
LARDHPCASPFHALPNGVRWLAWIYARQMLCWQRRHFDLYVDAIE